ncbi:DsbA family protein [Phytohabitans flavus]|uniref:Thioredoxin domain-containing protein n=1 Tax=Phytohabitans flavus TaxID=1076124 RepID=A0A6F8XQV3_9ACTN|nr:DsbA family protein [Phytohabitans flavus]BCB76203.1 hypothetical protein Pflav_026130 [Phytohabitans flavus]
MTTSVLSTSDRLAVPVNDQDHILGPDSAPVTLVEYGDYQCPYCARAHPVVQRLMRERAAQLRYVYRHFPITDVHPYAEVAAEAAEAAGVRGQFWRIHDWLFTEQDQLTPRTLITGLAGLGLDTDVVADEIRSHVYLAKVRADFIGGIRSDVHGTPTFFVNGIRHTEGYTLRELTAAVDQATS